MQHNYCHVCRRGRGRHARDEDDEDAELLQDEENDGGSNQVRLDHATVGAGRIVAMKTTLAERGFESCWLTGYFTRQLAGYPLCRTKHCAAVCACHCARITPALCACGVCICVCIAGAQAAGAAVHPDWWHAA